MEASNFLIAKKKRRAEDKGGGCQGLKAVSRKEGAESTRAVAALPGMPTGQPGQPHSRLHSLHIPESFVFSRGQKSLGCYCSRQLPA